ncbi:MAG: hypothetical protein EZS28_030576 [Streblomastix strix]|uniref:Uncharacterized protein n=1 Tax=Streblomastix strix TaxID=222440 RepID=A0A5J4UU47_9EUKA|nr:MAG: hypothetical protein EZS28_030576 [Streblomastix strix]
MAITQQRVVVLSVTFIGVRVGPKMQKQAVGPKTTLPGVAQQIQSYIEAGMAKLSIISDQEIRWNIEKDSGCEYVEQGNREATFQNRWTRRSPIPKIALYDIYSELECDLIIDELEENPPQSMFRTTSILFKLQGANLILDRFLHGCLRETENVVGRIKDSPTRETKMRAYTSWGFINYVYFMAQT